VVALERARRKREEIEEELEALRRSYAFTQREKTKGAKKHQAVIVAKAEKLKGQLAAIPEQKTLSVLRTEDEMEAADAVALLIAWLIEQVNVKRSMTDDQVDNLAADVVHGYGWLRLEDIALCFRNGLRGMYGPILDRLDAAILHDWLRQYGEDLRASRAAEQDSRRASAKEPMAERVSKSLRAFFYNQDEKSK